MSRRWLKIALAWAVTLASAMTVYADDADEPSLVVGDTGISERLASLEAEVERLRQLSPTTFASSSTLVDPAAPAGESGTAAGCLSGTACGPMIGQDFFNYGCRTGGVVAGAEAIFFKPFYTGAGAPNVDPAASNPFTGFVNYPAMPYNFTAAPRVWIGYVGENGLGGRFRFFDYRQTAANDVSVVFGAPPGVFTQTGMLALRTYDLELTQQVNFRYWSLQGYGGVRYAQVNQRSNVDLAGLSITNSALSFYGTGLTGGLQGERALTTNRRLSVFFSGRGSFLYGHQRDNTTDATGLYTEGNRVVSNAFASIWELSVGPQWKVPRRRGGEFFLRSSVEAQYWQNVGNFAPIGTSPSPGLNHNDLGGGFGLLGISGAIGIMR